MAKSIWTTIVKEVEQIPTYPGYRYIYFRSDEEAKAYFDELCGEGWEKLPWAQFLLGIGLEEDIERVRGIRHSRYAPTHDGLIGIDGRSKVIDNLYTSKLSFDYVIKEEVARGVRDPHAMLELIVERFDGAQPHIDHVRARINKYVRELGSRKNKIKASTLKDIVKSLHESGAKPPQIHRELRDMGINVTRQRVFYIIRDIKQETSGEIR